MSDNNKLPEQAKPQEFELIELLFREYLTSHIARPDIEYSFQARFQSFINQIPSYLHSVGKTGFFTHFFFGSFASLLDTKLGDTLALKKLHFNFDSVDHLRIVAETNDKMHVFIFTENNKNKKQNKNKDIGFTKDEWKTITGREYTDDDNKKLEISVIHINKSTGSINVAVEKQNIQDGASNTKQYHDITKQCVDKDGQYIALENKIVQLSVGATVKSEKAVEFILKYTKKIHDHYPNLPYGDKAREADEHGFVAGIFNNFRYRENAHVYLERFAGKGYADIVLFVRGPDRTTKSIPIIIELKAGTGPSTNSDDALNQVEEYTKGFQPNNMRILSLADNILCVGMNLDSPSDSFMQMKVVARDQEVVPLIQSLTDSVKKVKDSNIDIINQEIQSNLEKTYNTFPGTGEKSSAHYMSRFLLGESLVLKDYDKHIFIYDKASYIPTVTVIDDHGTRSKKPKIEKIVDGSNAVNSILLISQDKDNPAIVLNIIDVNREVNDVIKLPLDAVTVGNRKIISLDIKFRLDKYQEGFQQYCDVEIGKIYNSVLEYNHENTIKSDGTFYKISFTDSVELVAQIKSAIDSQEGLVISESRYKELMVRVGEIVYPIKSLIGRESEFQGLLEGVFKYYSDVSLSEGAERSALVLTEFQTGAGGRIDMLMQAIGPLTQGSKEYIPVGFELKYDDAIKLDSRGRKQDQNIQQILLEGKEQQVVQKLLQAQTERYSKGAAIKSITDGHKVAIMGIVFNAQSIVPNKLLLTTDKFLEAEIVHSSKLYTISDGVMVQNINDLPPPESEEFIPDWVEHATIDTLAKMQGEDQALLSLFNKGLDDKKIRELQNVLKDTKDVRSIDGIDLSYNHLTASGITILTKMLNAKLIYIDLSDNDLAQDNFDDFKELIKKIEVPILKIADIGLDNQYMSEVIKLLQTQDKLSHLEIQHSESYIMDQNTAFSITDYITNTNMLSYLDISRCGIGDQPARIIAGGLKRQHTLNTLILIKNNIGVPGARSIKDALPSSAISSLDLSGNPLGIAGFDHIVNGITNPNSKVKVIKLIDIGVKYNRDHRVQSECLANAIKSLFSNKKLISLDISYNDIGTGLLSQIFDILSKAVDDHSLRDVSLAGNKIDWGSHQVTINTLKASIGQFFEKNQTIRSLNLADMELDDELGQEIALGLEQNGSLIHLDLSGNTKICRKTLSGLAKTLSTHQYLKYLNIADTGLNIEHVKTLFIGLKSNQDLTHLNLAHNDLSGILTDTNYKQIMDLDNLSIDFLSLLKGNTSLKYLNLVKCKLSSGSIKSLFAFLQENHSLEIVDIRGNTIDHSIVDYIVEVLRQNASQGLNRLKILYLDKGHLESEDIRKLTDKSLGISVIVDDEIQKDGDLLEEINSTCTLQPLGIKHFSQNDYEYEHTTLEHATNLGDYHYWLQQHDIVDIARVHYHYAEDALEVVGSVPQLSNILRQYRTNANTGTLTVILNIGQDGNQSNHWVGLVLHNINNELHAYYTDSIGSNISSNVASILSRNRILVHDISIMQQEDGHNCGLWALENTHTIRNILSINDNISVQDIRNSLSIPQSAQFFQNLRTTITYELRNDILRQGHIVDFGLMPEPDVILNNMNYWAESLNCLAIANVWKGYNKYKRSISNDKRVVLLLNKNFFDCTSPNIPPYKMGYELIKLVNLGYRIDHASCSIFGKLKHAFYSQLYSKMHGVEIEVLRGKVHEALLSNDNDTSKLSSVLNEEIKDLNVLEKMSNATFVVEAVERGNIEMTRLLIEKQANVNARDTKGNTALFYAINKNDKEVIKLLIKHNANLNIHNNDGDSPIHLALNINNTAICKLLIDAGADVDTRDAKKNTPLIIAAKTNNTELIKHFIAHGADVKAKNDNGDGVVSVTIGLISGAIGVAGAATIGVVGAAAKTGVAGAAAAAIGAVKSTAGNMMNRARGYSTLSSSDREILESVVEHGAELNIVDRFGNTPLHNAAASNNVEMVEFCINHGVNIDASNNIGNTALHITTNNLRYRGRITRDITEDSSKNDITRAQAIICILVKNNASLSIQNNNGDVALHLAIKNNSIVAVELLLKSINDGNLLFIENNNGASILELALTGDNHKILLCFINFRDHMGSSVLHLAIKNNKTELINLLIKNKIDLNIVDKDGFTALHLAVDMQHEELVQSFIAHKVNVNIQDMRGNTPMHLSAEVHNIKIFTMLLEANADLNLKNKANKTAIQLAKECGMDVDQFHLPEPCPYQVNKDLEDGNHHKHRHHHGEWHERAKHLINKKHNGDHQRERRDLEDTLKNNDNKQQLYDKLVASQEQYVRSDTDSRYDTIVQVQNAIGTRHTIERDASNLIDSKASPIVNSIYNKLAADWQGNLLLGYLLFGKKCSGAKCEITQEVVNEPKYSEYAHRLAYSSYVPVIEDTELVGEG